MPPVCASSKARVLQKQAVVGGDDDFQGILCGVECNSASRLRHIRRFGMPEPPGGEVTLGERTQVHLASMFAALSAAALDSGLVSYIVPRCCNGAMYLLRAASIPLESPVPASKSEGQPF